MYDIKILSDYLATKLYSTVYDRDTVNVIYKYSNYLERKLCLLVNFIPLLIKLNKQFMLSNIFIFSFRE